MASYFMAWLQIPLTYFSKDFEDFIEMLREGHQRINLLLHRNYEIIFKMWLYSPNHIVVVGPKSFCRHISADKV